MLREGLSVAAPAPGFAAVVVAYHPVQDVLSQLIDTLIGVVDVVWLVDNGETSCLADDTGAFRGAHVVWPGCNLGVAGAYNLAVKRTMAAYADVHSIFLFDQDSVLDPTCIEALKSAMLELRQRGEQVAQVGPVYYETQRRFFPPLICVEGLRIRRLPVDKVESLTRVSYMISSGSLVSLDALKTVSGFDEQLFIDYVDVEFGLRCQGLGYSSWVVRDARMNHAIGESPLTLGRWTLPSHSGLRRRYQARNAILLMRRSGISLTWKLHELARFPVRFLFMMMARNGLPGQIGGWWRGVLDGVMGNAGYIKRR